MLQPLQKHTLSSYEQGCKDARGGNNDWDPSGRKWEVFIFKWEVSDWADLWLKSKHILYMWSSKQSSDTDTDSSITSLHDILNAESESQDFQVVTNLMNMKVING